ncbi:MOSC domain-containing protein [Chitinimonas lacunae]|uniref:MOSC domain-containing protein n=1 Tax=Chitinimonas lacunae TaxID=1963018 RepID=A0ABV8MJL9_9NEIS
MHLSEIFVYPLKSCRGNSLTMAEVEAMGLRHDRRWMLVDEQGSFLTGRAHPRLVLIEVEMSDEAVVFRAPGMEPLQMAPGRLTDSMPVTVWSSNFAAQVGDDEADFWFSEFLGLSCRLVYTDQQTTRRVKRAPELPVSFADGAPLLLIGSASLDDLNSRLAKPVSIRNFRTNLLVQTETPYIEDGWRYLRIGEAVFEQTHRCSRCLFTTVDPDLAEPDPQRQPLATLNDYRRADDGVCFGVNLVARRLGMIRLGDTVELLDKLD